MATESNLPPFEDILFAMEVLPDMDERFQYLINLGRKLPGLPEELKTEENFVHGCQSSVWITSKKEGQHLEFQGESDAMIVSGLVAVLLSLYSGKTPEEVLTVDVMTEMEALKLEHHLSPSRRNGLSKMIERIRKDAVVALEA